MKFILALALTIFTVFMAFGQAENKPIEFNFGFEKMPLTVMPGDQFAFISMRFVNDHIIENQTGIRGFVFAHQGFNRKPQITRRKLIC